jgi:hypothetical protein
MELSASSRVDVKLPAWLYGNDLVGFAEHNGMKLHPVNASEQLWQLETLESYEGRQPRLCTVRTLAAPGQNDDWSTLKTIEGTDLHRPIPHELLASEKDRLLGGAPSLEKVASWLGLSATTATDDELIDAVQGGYELLKGTVTEDGPAFPNASVHFIDFSPVAARREAMVRLFLRLEEEPDLFEGRPSPGEGELAFGSAVELRTENPITRDSFLAPLFLCLSPWMWAIPGARVQGVVAYNLGVPVVGRSGEISDLLQLFNASGVVRSTPMPAVGPLETVAGLDWWVTRLNTVLGLLTDPSNFVSGAGVYRPRRQFESLLSIQQLGQRIGSAFSLDRDAASRRLLGFAGLDTLDGLRLVSFQDACTLSRCERVLADLETSLSKPVSDLLLPAARRAVEALRKCQEGFFLTSRVTSRGVTLTDKRGDEKEWTKESAVAQYLRVLRNANHGFSGENDADVRRDQILLAAHSGDVPGDIAFLPYLHWLHIMSDPERLRRKLAPKS